MRATLDTEQGTGEIRRSFVCNYSQLMCSVLFYSARSALGMTCIIHMARMGVFPPGFPIKISSIHGSAESGI